jgi:two-component system, NtrC family, sensor kinase
MEKSQKHFLDSEPLLFAKESKDPVPSVGNKKYFKLLIVDDENEIHVMTKLVLSDYVYMGASLKFLSAFSAKEAKTVIRENPDIACCLLDVVMETRDAGLEVARFIREDEKNKKLRIILRTGQPGKAPEKEIILTYDINDYKEKTELTNQKLFTTITTALRSYEHLEELEKKSTLIQTKNIRLNEEIARRIVAESNLTKYNRSLEKMIENKSSRLKTAILTLEATKEKLQNTRKGAIASDVSRCSLETFQTSNTMIDKNLKQMDLYGQAMTRLLEKYNLLEKIILSQKGEAPKKEQVTKTIQKIEAYKRQIDFETLLKDYPEIIKESAKGIQQISTAVSDIKLFISINEEPFQPMDLALLLKNNAVAGKETASEKIDIQLDLETVPLISIPPRHMKKALKAILKNAFQAISSKGIISVSCQYQDPDIIVCISDIGCGISREDLPHVFTPYFTGNQSNGKGLGLTFARSVIQNCNGQLNISSSRNEGTTVKIILPVKETDPFLA